VKDFISLKFDQLCAIFSLIHAKCMVVQNGGAIRLFTYIIIDVSVPKYIYLWSILSEG